MPAALAARYKSKAQQARVVTEAWAREQLFCANCDSTSLGGTPANNQATDFVCPRCSAPFQLKAKNGAIGATLGDGAFSAMMAAIREDRTPNLLVMRYDWPGWRVRDLILIPSFAFPASAIIKRKPLSPTARRAGWVGCNIALNQIPSEARISVVTESSVAPASEVREKFARVKPLKELSVKERGWTLDVLNAIRRLGKTEFTTAGAYVFERELEQLHPDNRHVRDKIRQKLQVLRDRNLLLHLGRNCWRLP